MAAELVLNHKFRWTVDHDDFGGFSGLWVSEDGATFAAIGDRGVFAEGRLVRSDGVITKVKLDRFGPLAGRKEGDPDPFLGDAEGLAVASDGTRYVSFEGNHRVWRYSDFAKRPDWTHKWDRFWSLQRNSGLEALAIDADGVLYAIPERSGKLERPFPVYRLKNGAWDEELSLTRSGRFLVVGADFGPDGMLYLLERDFEWFGGFRSRIRRFSLGASGFDGGETLLESRLGLFDNLEGLSVRRGADGGIVVTAISDDNFSAFQSTWFVEFDLVD